MVVEAVVVSGAGEVVKDRDVAAIGEWSDNGAMMVEVARLGYIEGLVLDLTYGDGAFWSEYRPENLVTNDLYKSADYAHDFRLTPFTSNFFDTVVFDPPYKLAGTPASGDMDEAFGTDITRTRAEVYALLVGGLAEASRLTGKWLLVKTMDMVSSGQVRWQADIATDVMGALEFRKVDSFLLKGGRPQPEGRKQVRARRNYSTLLAFKRGKGK